MRIYKLAAVAVAPLFLLGCPAPEEEPWDEDPVAEERVHQIGDTETLNLSEMHDSGVTGDVRFTVLTDWETDVVLEVDDARPNASYQAAIHMGTCDELGEERYSLNTVQTDQQGHGAASVTLDVRLADVMDGNHVVALFGPAADDDYMEDDPDAEDDEQVMDRDAPVACGEIGEVGQVGPGW